MEIPGYEIDRLLGAGAYGRVFLARETSGLQRPVALKVFDADHKDDFDRELAMTRSIEEVRRREHARELVQALGSGEADGRTWIVLEYIQPGSVADLVAKDGPLPLERALSCAADAARALALLHGEGIFHRDVKPANLLAGPDGRVRLGDFGLSRSLDGTLTAAGSPAFAAPEMIAGRPTEGRAADIYSLGATLSFILTGEAMLPGRPDVFSLERHGVPRPVQDAIVKAAALEPAERWRSVEAFAAALLAKESGKTEKRRRTKTGSHDVVAKGVAPMPVKLSKGILAACAVVLLASFMPWGTIGVDILLALGGPHGGTLVPTSIYAWTGHLTVGRVEIPLWLTVLLAAAIAAIEVLRVKGALAPESRRVSGALALGGVLLVLLTVHDISEGDGRFGIAVFATLSALLSILSIILRDMLPARRRDPREPEAPLWVATWKSKHRRERARRSEDAVEQGSGDES